MKKTNIQLVPTEIVKFIQANPINAYFTLKTFAFFTLNSVRGEKPEHGNQEFIDDFIFHALQQMTATPLPEPTEEELN